MTARPSARIDAELELRLVLPETGKVPVAADLGYEAEDPFAVTATFGGADDAVEWVFARDLLQAGLHGCAGEGDVQVSPSREDGRDVVLVALSTPDGHAVLEAGADDLRAFLARTHELVPPGTEGQWLDLDDELADLLDSAG